MTTPPISPMIANLLAKNNSAPVDMVDAPALTSTIASPNIPSPSIGTRLVPTQAEVNPFPTQTQTDQTHRNQLINSGDGISQIHNPVERGVLRALDITGSVFGPTRALEMAIPGTALHHNYLVNQATNNVQKDQAQEQATAQTAGTQAQTAQEQATTEATNENLAASKRAAQKAAVSGNILYDENKNPIGYQDPTGRMMGVHDPSLPQNIQDILSSVKGKTPTSEFELWHQQNPNGTAQDFQKVQSKPLTSDQATSLNNVWDALADKHHLPKGQFKEGMSGSDATQLQTALNNAVGKQQGDTHVSISLQGMQNQQAKNAPLDMSDPAMQSSVAATAAGQLKLSDVFGRGATTAQKAAYVAEVKKINPNYNSGDHDIENGARRYMISGQGGQTLTAINTAYHHLDNFDAAAKAMGNGDLKSLNQLGNELGVQIQSGASPQVTFDLVKTALKGEMARAFTGAGATVDEQHSLDVSFNNANSPATMLAVTKQARSLLQGKEKALSGQLQAGQRGQANFGALDSGSPGGSGMAVSLKDAMSIPANKGKSESDVRKDIEAHGHTVKP